MAFPKNTRVSIRFGPRQWVRLREVAAERGETMAELVRLVMSITVLKEIEAVPLPAPAPKRRGRGVTV